MTPSVFDPGLESVTVAETRLSRVRSEDGELLLAGLPIEVEPYAAALLAAVDVPPAPFAATFAVSRVGGWVAHCLEQRADNRLVRPVGRYVGARDREWRPIEDR